jgi:hypothetical protein
VDKRDTEEREKEHLHLTPLHIPKKGTKKGHIQNKRDKRDTEAREREHPHLTPCPILRYESE